MKKRQPLLAVQTMKAISTRSGGRMRNLLWISLLAGTICCNDPSTLLRDVGVLDETIESLTLDILLDASDGSPCCEECLDEALLAVDSAQGDRALRLWLLGQTVGQTRLIATGKLENNTSPKARPELEQKSEATLEDLRRKVHQALSQPRARNRSPLLESLTKLSFATTPEDARRVIVVISDLREVSRLADLECGEIPRASSFLSVLHEKRILVPGSLNGASVIFTNARLDEVPRDCPTTMEREVAIRELWDAIIRAAGASQVEFKMESLEREDLSREEQSQ